MYKKSPKGVDKTPKCAVAPTMDWLLEAVGAALEIRNVTVISNFKEVHIIFYEKVKSLFSSTVQSVASAISNYAAQPEKDFTRRKKFPQIGSFPFWFWKEDIEFIFELSERRFDTTSTIFCTLYRQEDWVKRLGGGSYAESIVERFAYNIIWVETSDVNMRQIYSHA